MPEFYASESRTAKATMRNPTGKDLSYQAALILGLPEALRSEASFSIPAGGEKVIGFPVTMPAVDGTYPVYLHVTSEGKEIKLYRAEDVRIIRAITLSFTNPKKGAVLWDAKLYDVDSRQWVGGIPAGAKALDVACRLEPTGNTFLLQVMELPPAPLPGPYWLGPYLVTIPKLGAYTWNSSQGRINGTGTVDMPNTPNLSFITGVITGLSWKAEGVWAVTMTIEKSEGGASDYAQYFNSIYILYAAVPLDSLKAPVMKVGDKVTCRVTMFQDTYDAAWNAWDFHAYHTYPPAAFNFSGSVTVGGVVRKQYEAERDYWVWGDFRQINWSVSGGIPPFAVRVVKYGMFGNVTGFQYSGPGPASGTYEVLEDAFQAGYEGRLAIYAHPSTSPPEWDQYSWQYNNWKLVAGN
jgi:hypothetical protein